MNTEFIREGNRTLYCFSIFYAQDEWGRILPLLHTYMMSNPDIHQYMFFLSYERGEHIRLIFSSYTVHGAILQEAVYQALKKIVVAGRKIKLPQVPGAYGYNNLGWSVKKNADTAKYQGGQVITVKRNLKCRSEKCI